MASLCCVGLVLFVGVKAEPLFREHFAMEVPSEGAEETTLRHLMRSKFKSGNVLDDVQGVRLESNAALERTRQRHAMVARVNGNAGTIMMRNKFQLVNKTGAQTRLAVESIPDVFDDVQEVRPGSKESLMRTGKRHTITAATSVKMQSKKVTRYSIVQSVGSKIDGDRRRRINVYWGGKAHGARVWPNRVRLYRPEWMKMERCTADRCEECVGENLCWHGVGKRKEGGKGHCEVSTTQGQNPDNFVNFTLVMHVKCDAGRDVNVRLHTNHQSGGSLKVFWDASEVSQITKPRATQTFMLPSNAIKELQLTWVPNQSDSFVKLWPRVVGVLPEFVDCEDHQVCLEKLGTGDHIEEGLSLRGENVLMRSCLENSLSIGTPLATKCAEWTACLDTGDTTNMRQRLLNSLVAAKVPNVAAGASLAEVKRTSDAPGCLNPLLADIPGWLCDCYDTLTSICTNDHSDMLLTECMTMLLCCSSSVCSTWKEVNCNPAACVTSSASLLGRASVQVKRGPGPASMDQSFDESVGTKACS